MKRWISEKSAFGENERIDNFLNEVINLCKKHGFSIGHEDGHGSFEIYDYDPGDEEWLLNANDLTK